jgi:hypothetical protein
MKIKLTKKRKKQIKEEEFRDNLFLENNNQGGLQFMEIFLTFAAIAFTLFLCYGIGLVALRFLETK